ncbi:uncharacterized protein [Lepeophtheirus salmonis]|uniref:uncharacterized protein n=1 Tax=Lepeophtheirus salmonis TaxID=72036 RepID=UPI001AE63411|nr:ankyrin-1-like [Lepeophtheirus salmonis]XP_040583762.1 ankyrin-1-like [Lepeophtheirus salmonis]XP_040583763.1 ankyrin-1-like [Lepeophtheirus salmonis]XP_040583764.1 ankyrin-1-like [Lepeophtheirus salmonis]XP_040583771.1 ankyrin-1-like [Lepeophtheirus salmonis]XP_040583772.1 ankyrin-1-like [Lepeophtheirus salmonis]XP_040583773.1 ankyrin-1-like [Lepeophtheirus salmonis]XP_040583774.1 ankyrin-1-like [Lepeophtheirus salmonis]
MGGALSHFFQSGHALLSYSHNRAVSEQTRRNIRIVFDALRANPKVTVQRLDGLLSTIPRSENILQIHNEEGYNLLQKCVGINNLEMIRWCLSRNIDINRGACSLPLHIACLKGYEDAVELLLKHGARVDVEARMCWPGHHQQNCEERGKHSTRAKDDHFYRSSDKLQCAIYYAIDGDQVDILELLAQQGEDHWLPWQQKRPLLHIACERGAWNCVKYLVSERSDEINQCYDEYYPIHQASLHDIKFLELLIQCGAETTVRTPTQLMTALHVVLLQGKKTAEDTLQTTKLLMEHGLRDLINEADSLGNTPLHVLIVRYALEERRYGYHDDHQPWNKWDMLHIVRYLLQNGARPSINHTSNSALACVLRHVTDWEFRYDLLHMLLQEGGDPNVEGRDGSVPLMVCLVPLINKDPLHHFNHTMKVCYLNCVRILCQFGGNPNCSTRSNLTPLHVLMFTASENISLAREDEKSSGFEFIRNLLTVLLQHGLDPNVRFSQRSNHILYSLMDMVKNARFPKDLSYVYDLTLTLIQFGANPNVSVDSETNNNSTKTSTLAFIKKNPTRVIDSFVRLLITKEHLCSKDGDQDHFARILRLYYFTMNHAELYSSLKVLYAQTGMIPMKSSLGQVIKELYSKPRTLKQMTRVIIYNHIGQKPALNANKLPLPPALREYILSFEP